MPKTDHGRRIGSVRSVKAIDKEAEKSRKFTGLVQPFVALRLRSKLPSGLGGMEVRLMVVEVRRVASSVRGHP